MSSSTAETPIWQQPDQLVDLEVCLEHFNLRGSFEGKEHRCGCLPRDEEWREREWGRYDIAALIDLCHLCARNTMSSGSRWSCYACDTCLGVNRAVGAVFGRPKVGVLPLGVHSMMNGVSFGGDDTSDAAFHAFFEGFERLTGFWKRITEWKKQEAGRLAAGADWDDDGTAVPLITWMEMFPTSEGASVDSFCRFIENDLPDHPSLQSLVEARTRFPDGSRP